MNEDHIVVVVSTRISDGMNRTVSQVSRDEYDMNEPIVTHFTMPFSDLMHFGVISSFSSSRLIHLALSLKTKAKQCHASTRALILYDKYELYF